MTFHTGGSEQVRIGATSGTDLGTVGIGYSTLTGVGTNGLAVSGNVGIGTSSPGAKLVVNGGTSTSQIRLEVNNAAFTQEVSTNAAVSAYVYKSNDASYHVWKLSSSEAMRIDTSGNVGIGTSSPGVKLDVNGALRVGLASNPTTIAGNSQFYDQSGIGPTISGYHFTVRTGSSTPTESMRIDSSGNVGIGISSPSTYGRLAVVANDAYNPNVVFVSDASAANWARADWKNVNVAYTGIIYMDQGGLFNIRNDGANAIAFSTNGGNERMRIDSSGNVIAGGSVALATTATNGFLYVPTCAGTPTGTPTAVTGMAPIVVNTTNNKLYFYSGGAWRDAGP